MKPRTTLHTTTTHEPYRAGRLEIHRTYFGAALQTEVFTLKSLGACLGLSPAATNAAYNRRQLANIAVFARGRGGRPMRAFPLHMLADVTLIMETPGATARKPESPGVMSVNGVNPPAQLQLAAENLSEGRFITVESIARQMRQSTSSVRARLARANMLQLAVTADIQPRGGRPRKGWPEHLAGDLLRVFTENYSYSPTPRALLVPPTPRPAPGSREHIASMSDAEFAAYIDAQLATRAELAAP